MNPPLGVLDYPLITVGSAIISRTRGHLFYVTGAYPGTPEEVCALLNKAIAQVINTQTFVPVNIEYYDPREDAHVQAAASYVHDALKSSLTNTLK